MKKIDYKKFSSYRSDYEELELELGHVPDYNEEQESEIIIDVNETTTLY
jgi:hypothetical protein